MDGVAMVRILWEPHFSGDQCGDILCTRTQCERPMRRVQRRATYPSSGIVLHQERLHCVVQ